MCDEGAFILFYQNEHRHLADVDLIQVEENALRLKHMNGSETVVPGRVRTIDLVNRRIETTE